MNLDQAEFVFHDIVRGSPVPWSSLRDVRAHVATYVLSKADELDALITPWWVDGLGQRSSWDSTGARAVSVREQPLPAARQTEVTEIARMFESFQPPIQVMALSYELPEGRQFLLDGTHRVAALSQLAVPFRLILVSIQGPIDGKYLPELAHFAGVTF